MAKKELEVKAEVKEEVKQEKAKVSGIKENKAPKFGR